MAQFRQPDFTKGDPNTLAGYAAVHERPAAFEGSDGFSYTAEILTEQQSSGAWSGYLFFVKWARVGSSAPEGHLESEYLRDGRTEEEARVCVGEMKLSDVKKLLDKLIAKAPGGAPKRKWWDAMNADDDSEQHHS